MLKRMAGWMALLAVMALVGCAQLGKAPSAPEEIDLELQGRVALRYGEEGGSARISWRHSASTDDMLITSALGQGIARITRDAGVFRLVTADGKEYQATDAQALTESVLGWRLPLEGLADWLRGRPSASSPSALRRADDGRLLVIDQNDWHIEFPAWQDALPSRVNLRHKGVDGKGAIEIRLVIDEIKARS